MALTQVSSNGISKPVDLADNEKVRLGTDNDLEVYHTGSGAYIQNKTGNIFIASNVDDDDGGDIRIQPKYGENSIVALDDGAVELYHDNVKKFETRATDCRVYDDLKLEDDLVIKLGTADDLQLYHSSGNSSIVNATGVLTVKNSGAGKLQLMTQGAQDVEIKTNNELSIKCVANGAAELYHDNSLKFKTDSIGCEIAGALIIPDGSASGNRISVGNAGDLKIYHDGSHSNINNATGNLRLQCDAFRVNSQDNSESIIRGDKDGSVELYHDGTKKFNTTSGGIELAGTLYTGQGHVANVMNRESDGTLLEFKTTGTARGSITVSGNTVSYNGGHLSRWSQIKGLSSTDKSARPTIYKGTVMSNLDDLCVWKDKEPEQLNMTKVSDTVGDKDVAGVFLGWDEDNTVEVNDFYVSMTGDMVIRVAASTTVARGDLLISAGDGTAKPQADDIVRSSTIAKITSTISTTTYADGSKAYPCVLMAC